MIFLDVDRVTEIHEIVIKETGGEAGVLFQGTLDYCVQKHQLYFYGLDPYPDVFQKTAALMHCLILSHPFVDGNKRTGIVVATIFLDNNSYRLNVEKEEAVDFTIRIAMGNAEISEVASWLLEHSTFVPS